MTSFARNCMSASSLSHDQLFVTPGTVAHQTPLSLGFSRQEFWRVLPLTSPEKLPNPENKPWSPASQADSLPFELQESISLYTHICIYIADSLPFDLHGSMHLYKYVQFRSVVSYSLRPCESARQASLSITNSRSLLKHMSIESVMQSSHLILCHPLLFLPPVPPRIRVFSNESTLHMRWPKY